MIGKAAESYENVLPEIREFIIISKKGDCMDQSLKQIDRRAEPIRILYGRKKAK